MLVLPAALLLAGAAASAQSPAPKTTEPTKAPEKPEAQVPDPAQLPPEEDTDAKPEEYSFNPVKSKRDVEVGRQQLKKGNLKGAASRFTTATRWNDANAEAWLFLGEVEEKREDPKGARTAYEKYLQLAPTAKNAAEIRKRLDHLK
jgi:tetratricopeptide (TPR) repeat protein